MPKMSVITPPMRAPLRSITFAARLRTRLRCATSVRRWRQSTRSSRAGTKLGVPSPNWHTRASQRLSSMSVLRSRSCRTCCALSSCTSIPAFARASNGASQYTPVASIDAASTRCPASHSVSADRPLARASKRRVSHTGAPAASLSRTVAVISIL